MVVKAVLAVVHTAVTTRTGISSCTTLSHLFGTVKRNASAKPAALALSMEAAVVAVKCGLAQKALKLQYHSKVPYVLLTVAWVRLRVIQMRSATRLWRVKAAIPKRFGL